MMPKAWSGIEEVPYSFSRSSVKFQGHTAPKIVEFDPNWAFPDCNSSLNSPMAMKCCTKLETAKERCPIVFQGHPSNFKVTRYKTSPILTQIGRFRTIGQSQLPNPSDLPCLYHWSIIWQTLIFPIHILHFYDVLWLACLELSQDYMLLHWLNQDKSLLCSLYVGLSAFLTLINTWAMMVKSKIHTPLQAPGDTFGNFWIREWIIVSYIQFW